MHSIQFKQKYTIIGSIFLALSLFLVGSADAQGKTESQREKVRASIHVALAQLYDQQPSAQRALESAYGYAVFNNFGMAPTLITLCKRVNA